MVARLLLASMLAVAPLLAYAAGPPAIEPEPVRTDYAGVMVTDAYRQLEKLDRPQVRAWALGQTEHTRRTLDRLPGLPALRSLIDALNASVVERISWIQRTSGGRLFYLKRRAEDAVPKLYTRDSLAKPERVVFDPVRTDGVSQALSAASASPDGRYVAAVVSPGDSELGELRVWNVETGAVVTPPIPRVWGQLSAGWLPDSSGFLYTRTTFGENEPPYGRMRVSLRILGKPESDRPVLGWEVPDAPAAREADWPFIMLAGGSPYAVSLQARGVNTPLRIHVARLEELGRPNTRWQSIVDEEAGIRDAWLWGRWLYLRTFQGATRFRILRLDLSQPDARPVEWIPEHAGVIEGMGVADDGLYYVVREGALSELYRAPHDTGAAKIAKLSSPYRGALQLAHVEPGMTGALVTIDTWTQSQQLLAARVGSDKLENTPLLPMLGGGFEALETHCTARDGARVPVSILMPRGLKRDATTATLLYGYGGYGRTETARYNTNWLAWVERGGVLAVVNPRGSGAYGEDWYRAGSGASKANTWRDMIDCGQMLIAERYTSAAKLAIFGGSAGGIAVGRAVTERPDLFAAAAVFVGLLDAVRFVEVSVNGPNHEIEMGSHRTRAGIEQLLAMSSYHHVQDGTRYPAVLLAHGMNDKRVEPWQSMKMAARLQAAGSDKLVLLRLEMQSGHGISAEVAQRNQLYADTYAFLLWQMGDPAFQPPDPL
jgi:prolyl oligopeptidase